MKSEDIFFVLFSDIGGLDE